MCAVDRENKEIYHLQYVDLHKAILSNTENATPKCPLKKEIT